MLLLSLLLFECCPNVWADDPVSAAVRLSGGVSHSDKLEPLPVDDRIGAAVPPPTYTQPSATALIKDKGRGQKRQVIAPTFAPPSQAYRPPKQVQWQLPLPPARQANRQTWNGAGQQQRSFQSIPSSQQATVSRAAQLAQAQQAQHQADESLHASQAAQSQQAAIKMLAQLNAHVNTQGSPQAPRFQVMPMASQADPRFQSRSAGLDPAAQYQKNLQAIASLDLSHTAHNQALQAGIKAGGQSVKVEVPFWLAGEWVRTETTESSRIELPSGKSLKPVGKQKASVTDVFGMSKDKAGKVWMVVPLHNRGAVDRGFAIDRSQVNKYELILTGKTSALVKVQAAHSVIDKRTNRVIQAYQDEEFNEYSLIKDGLVKTDSSVKVFDQMGNAKLLTRAVSTERRTRKL